MLKSAHVIAIESNSVMLIHKTKLKTMVTVNIHTLYYS